MLIVKLKDIDHKSYYNSQAGYVVDDEYIIDTEKDSYAIPLEDIESIDVVEDKQYNLYWKEDKIKTTIPNSYRSNWWNK